MPSGSASGTVSQVASGARKRSERLGARLLEAMDSEAVRLHLDNTEQTEQVTGVRRSDKHCGAPERESPTRGATVAKLLIS